MPFLRASIRELAGRVDEIFISIPNVSHSGLPLERDFIDSDLSQGLELEGTTLTIHEIDDKGFIRNAEQSAELHYNEYLTRKAFAKRASVKGTDLVLALDADEVPFGSQVEELYGRAHARLFPIRLNFRQFFYRPNLLWEKFVFRGPVLSPVGLGQFRKLGFRDIGLAAPVSIQGCHFSWHLSAEEMVVKLRNYSHAQDYKSFANIELLSAALRSRTYPFDPNVEFSIRELNWEEFELLVPEGLLKELPAISHMLPSEFLGPTS